MNPDLYLKISLQTISLCVAKEGSRAGSLKSRFAQHSIALPFK